MTFCIRVVLIYQLLCLLALAQERVSIGIIPPQNLSDTNASQLSYTIPLFFSSQLAPESRLRVLPDSSINFALYDQQYNTQKTLSSKQVLKIGRLIEAGHVLWGNYERRNGDVYLDMQMVDIETGLVSKHFKAHSSDVNAVVSQIRQRVLAQLGMTPSLIVEAKMVRPWTSSNEALGLLMQAYADSQNGFAISNIVAELRQAIILDPHFAEAQQALAHLLVLEGNSGEGLNIAKMAVANDPDSSSAHFTLGEIYMSLDSGDLASKELQRAIQIDPDNADSYGRLAENCFKEGKWQEGVAILTKAESLAPFDASIYALLGYGYINLSEPDQARLALRFAERYDIGGDPGIEEALAKDYERMNDVPKAIELYEKFLGGAKKSGAPASFLERDEHIAERLKSTLSPRFVNGSAPQSYTAQELDRTLRARLAPNEYSLAINPMATTPEINRWAEQLVGDAPTDMEKARRLFDGLTQHINVERKDGMRTAGETFKDWSNPQSWISCQDYTLLYLAMARHLGLDAYFVAVTKDYTGRDVDHACVGVFVDGRALLVDPMYVWFGVPHKEYEFENDLRVVGIFMFQLPDEPRNRIGLKLVPDWAMPHFLMAIREAYRGHPKEAHQMLQDGLKEDSKSGLSLYTQAIIEIGDKDWDSASAHFRQCLVGNPEYPNVHYFLAKVLQTEGKLNEARDELRIYLGMESHADHADDARETLTTIDRSLAESSGHLH